MDSCDHVDGVVGRAIEIVEIAEVNGLLESGGVSMFTEAERLYAESKSDPERRLAARLAAKRALCRLLDDAISPEEIEVLPARGGPPRLALSETAARLCSAKDAGRILLSLTHGRTHAAACVLLVRDEP
jgi:holo-[acyl-carrier protein] synthase